MTFFSKESILVAFVCICVLSIVSSNGQTEMMQSRVGYTCWTFPLLCVFKCVLKLLASDDAYSHWLHLFDFSPLCVFKCLLKLPASDDAYLHWLHLLDFSPLCVFKCLLKLLTWEDLKSHWLHLFDFSPLCVFKCFLKSPA